jgi:hypothetical protein
MPSFIWSRAMTANQLGDNPLTGWQYEYVPREWPAGAYVKVLQRATTTGVRTTLYAGSQTIQQRSPVQGGGTAGVTPSELNTQPADFIAAPGDRLLILNDEVAAGTPTVDGVLILEPV